MEVCHTPHFILTDCHLFFFFLTLCASITALFRFLLQWLKTKLPIWTNVNIFKRFKIQIAPDLDAHLDGVQMTIQVGDSQS